jgi:hypothetical protein
MCHSLNFVAAGIGQWLHAVSWFSGKWNFSAFAKWV